MIVGFGALNLDKIYLVDKIPQKDEEGYVIDLQTHPGGSAANTIAGLSEFGLKTSFIGKIGNDEEGRKLLRDFEGRGVDTSGIIRAEGRSGVAMIFVDKLGNRAILVDPGVNDTIRVEEINFDVVEKARIIHMTSFICKNGVDSLNSQKIVAEKAEDVSFDPGLPYVERGLDEIKPILKNTTIFLPNKREIELLMGTNFIEASRIAIELGVEIVVVKLGSEGCYVTNGKKESFFKPFASKVIDTTGAGDAFNAGFLYGWSEGKSLEVCAKMGNYVASRIIERVGARSYHEIHPREVLKL